MSFNNISINVQELAEAIAKAANPVATGRTVASNSYFAGAGVQKQAPAHIRALLLNEKDEKSVAQFATGTPLHGTGGLWASPGLDRTVVSAYVSPQGIGEVLAKIPTVDENPLFGTLVGFSDDVGSEPTNVCADAPAGYMLGCNLTARFGMVRRDTQTIDYSRVALRLNRGDFKDLILAGQVLGLSGLTPSGLNQTQILNIQTAAEMVTAGALADRKLSRDLWQGTVAAGTFPGLDVQIAEGQIDAETQTPCPAVDSLVLDFNYNSVDGSSPSIVRYLSTAVMYVETLAENTRMAPVDLRIVMRPQLWFELTDVWAQAYNTQGQRAVESGAQVFVDGREMVAERDGMRSTKTITVNGKTYGVVTDTEIFEHNSTNNGNLDPGEFAGSIYGVPLTVGGSIPATYIEYVDFRQADLDLRQVPGLAPLAFWTDEGLYSWTETTDKWCRKYSLLARPRVVLRTPQFAFRIDHVKYIPLKHLRDTDPDSEYHAAGGVSGRVADVYHAVWTS